MSYEEILNKFFEQWLLNLNEIYNVPRLQKDTGILIQDGQSQKELEKQLLATGFVEITNNDAYLEFYPLRLTTQAKIDLPKYGSYSAFVLSKESKAVQLLSEFKGIRLDEEKTMYDEFWFLRLKKDIKTIFGVDSAEYAHASTFFALSKTFIAYGDPTPEKKAQEIRDFINQCIKTARHKEIELPKKSSLVNPSQKFDYGGQDVEKLAENYMASIFPLCHDYEYFHINTLIKSLSLEKEKQKEALSLREKIDKLMTVVYLYADRESAATIPIRLTAQGRKAKQAGGHFEYQKRINKIETTEASHNPKNMPTPIRSIEQNKTAILQYLNTLPSDTFPANEEVMEATNMRKEDYDTATALLRGLILVTKTHIAIKPEGKQHLENLANERTLEAVKQLYPEREHKQKEIKEMKHNMFATWSNDQIIALVIAAGGILFYAGNYFGDLKADNKNVELRIENGILKKNLEVLKDSILLLRNSTLHKSDSVPNRDTSGNKE